MNKLTYLFLLLTGMFLFSSCGKDDKEEIDEAYKQAQEAAFNAKANDPDYQKAEISGGPGYVYYKILEQGTGTISPIFTSQVEVYYKGWLIDGTVFDSIEEGVAAVPYTFKIDGTSYEVKNPITGTTTKNQGVSVINGWKVALQHMKIGDKWEVWIPASLAYGSTAQGSIPAYSTLIFELELVGIPSY